MPRQGSSKVFGIRDQRSARGWDQGSRPWDRNKRRFSSNQGSD